MPAVAKTVVVVSNRGPVSFDRNDAGEVVPTKAVFATAGNIPTCPLW